jgi:prophage regulatory protein
MTPKSKIVSLAIARERTLRSRTSIYNDIKCGRFPIPIQIGARRIGFLESDIDAWIEERVQRSKIRFSDENN